MADKMTRCPEGHFYDPTKHVSCPWCALPPDIEGGERTRPSGGPPPLPPPLPPPPPLARAAVTRRAGADAQGTKCDPVVGWLVCLAGPDRGRDFRLHAEKNFIGRSPAMDVCVANDESVSRDRHAMVIFDPKKKMFWAVPGDASGLVYLNGDIVHSPTQIERDDVLEVGQTKLALIPFCGEKYTWSRELTTMEMETPDVPRS